MVKKSRGGQTINSSQKRRQSYLRRKKIGAVLIEFAFAIPVFLILIYYIYDLPKYKLMQRKMQFVSNIMAATIQNISEQKKGTDNPKITAKDIQNALRLSYLAVFPGMTMYSVSDMYRLPYGYGAHATVNCVKGTGENQAQSQWIIAPYVRRTNDGDYWKSNSNVSWNVVGYSSSPTNSSNIYPDLVVENGEYRIILACYLWLEGGICFADGTPSFSTPRKNLFNFLFLTPQSGSSFRGRGSKMMYFPGVTIFRPINGSFDDKLPQ